MSQLHSSLNIMVTTLPPPSGCLIADLSFHAQPGILKNLGVVAAWLHVLVYYEFSLSVSSSENAFHMCLLLVVHCDFLGYRWMIARSEGVSAAGVGFEAVLSEHVVYPPMRGEDGGGTLLVPPCLLPAYPSAYRRRNAPPPGLVRASAWSAFRKWSGPSPSQ
ncbi:hypothetical protein CYMTET_4615 [Cymbomonas tetramitiformis]|uniref:Uncharacterized protein n=1 Tax=Cymbomonas tetramitiformis TaxID=36881 RepID=A0AAE0LJX8_9CHLO|nr:hypothetical protein CYMTET_4615 [Cymbomonas tetramitiformis]